MKIVLQGTQSITDGCVYSPAMVLSIKQSQQSLKKLIKSGFNTFANKGLLLQHRYIKKGQLLGYNWKELYKTQHDTLKELVASNIFNINVKKHIQDFWTHYNLSFDYEIEHKVDHTALRVFFIKKAHYALKTIENQMIYKFRGLNPKYNSDNLYYKIADYMLKDPPKKWSITEKDLEYTLQRLSTCQDYLNSINSNDPDKKVIYPAFLIKSTGTFKLTNDDLLVNTKKQHKNRSKRNYGLMLIQHKPEKVFSKRFKDHMTNIL